MTVLTLRAAGSHPSVNITEKKHRTGTNEERGEQNLGKEKNTSGLVTVSETETFICELQCVKWREGGVKGRGSTHTHTRTVRL